MRVPGMRKLAAVAVPFALVAGALVYGHPGARHPELHHQHNAARGRAGG